MYHPKARHKRWSRSRFSPSQKTRIWQAYFPCIIRQEGNSSLFAVISTSPSLWPRCHFALAVTSIFIFSYCHPHLWLACDCGSPDKWIRTSKISGTCFYAKCIGEKWQIPHDLFVVRQPNKFITISQTFFPLLTNQIALQIFRDALYMDVYLPTTDAWAEWANYLDSQRYWQRGSSMKNSASGLRPR